MQRFCGLFPTYDCWQQTEKGGEILWYYTSVVPECDSDLPLFAMIPWKMTVLIFELFEQAAFINVGNDSGGSDDCRKGDKLIIFNSTLLGQPFVRTMLCNWSVKPKILSNFVWFVVNQK